MEKASANLKVLCTVSDVDKVLAFEWLIKEIDRVKMDLSFVIISRNASKLSAFLKAAGITCYEIRYSNKIGLIVAFFSLIRIILSQRPTVIHTHLFLANILGLTAAWLMKVSKRIYTRHHALIHHRDHPGGLIFDRICNYMATDIIVPSKNVEKILSELERVPPEKIHLIHHGFDLSYFERINILRINALKDKYEIQDHDSPILGVIARYTHWKGIQYIIPAFKELLKKYPQAKIVLANAKGDYSDHIQNLLADLPKSNVLQIEFEEDLGALYGLFNIYVHTPIDAQSEAFGQTYVEALAAGIPTIATLSGVASEFYEDKKNALLVNYCDSDGILHSIEQLIHSPELRNSIVEEGKESVKAYFKIGDMTSKLYKIYMN